MDGELISAEEFFNMEPELGGYSAPVYSEEDLKPFEKMKIRMGSCGYEQELYSETLPQGKAFCGNYPICQCPRCGKDAFDAQLFVNGRIARGRR